MPSYQGIVKFCEYRSPGYFGHYQQQIRFIVTSYRTVPNVIFEQIKQALIVELWLWWVPQDFQDGSEKRPVCGLAISKSGRKNNGGNS